MAPVGTVAGAAAPQQDGTSAADLVLPLIAGVAALTVAGYGYLRRTRRARTRTTPGTVSAHPPVPAPADSERQARAALRLADDCVRTSREELAFVRELFGEKRTEPFTHALRAAETELSAAFAIWRRYEEGVPEEPGARRQALVRGGRPLRRGRAPAGRGGGGAGSAARAGRESRRTANGEWGAALVTAEERFRELGGAGSDRPADPGGPPGAVRALGGRARHRVHQTGRGPVGVRHRTAQRGPPGRRHGRCAAGRPAAARRGGRGGPGRGAGGRGGAARGAAAGGGPTGAGGAHRRGGGAGGGPARDRPDLADHG
ncbi:hypothetical protein LT493_33210 [Streptomyces tricolor]|nr:hypothetical protein [Streptomyces tricolor]